MMVARTVIAILLCGALVPAASGRGQSTTGADAARSIVTLGVGGAANATPSLTVAGRTVVAAWTSAAAGSVNVYVAISNDSGATFSEPRRVNHQDGDASANNEQPPRVAISGSGATQTITVLWSKRNDGAQRTRQDVIRMARSIDGGRTFAPARSTHPAGSSGARGWQSLTTGSDSLLYAVWLDGRDAERKMAEAMAHTGAPHKGQPPQDVYLGTIHPDGRVVESLIATGVCFCCKTAVAAGGRGVVYAAWRHIFPGSMRDIAFARSTDGGRHFGPPVRVSEDKWELNGCPEDGPAMAVDPSGVIHLAWATLVTEGEPHKALFYATSRDGATFTSRIRVPAAARNSPGHPQMTTIPDGGAAIVWDEVVGGVRRVSISRVDRRGAFPEPQILSGDESALAPVIERSATGDLLVAWTSRSTTGTASDPSQIKIRRVGL